jgi:hypothetical protein
MRSADSVADGALLDSRIASAASAVAACSNRPEILDIIPFVAAFCTVMISAIHSVHSWFDFRRCLLGSGGRRRRRRRRRHGGSGGEGNRPQ